MTTTRINHSNCSHPRTPAGRRACRAGFSATPVSATPRIVRTRGIITMGRNDYSPSRIARGR